MEFWLSWNNKAEQHQLPVLPSHFEIETSNMNTVVNINDIGNINLIGKSDLKKITLESFFPNQDYTFVATQNRWNPYVYVESIERWRKSGKPIRLIITDTPINLALAIESFTYGERDGSGDVYFVLELAEYVFTNFKQEPKKDYVAPSPPPRQITQEELKISEDIVNYMAGLVSAEDQIISNGVIESLTSSPFSIEELRMNEEVINSLTRGDTREIPNTYVVKPNDTLSTISKQITGNSANYQTIMEKNNIKNPNSITVGQELKL